MSEFFCRSKIWKSIIILSPKVFVNQHMEKSKTLLKKISIYHWNSLSEIKPNLSNVFRPVFHWINPFDLTNSIVSAKVTRLSSPRHPSLPHCTIIQHPSSIFHRSMHIINNFQVTIHRMDIILRTITTLLIFEFICVFLLYRNIFVEKQKQINMSTYEERIFTLSQYRFASSVKFSNDSLFINDYSRTS